MANPSQTALKIHSHIPLKIHLEISLRSPLVILLEISLTVTLKNRSEMTFKFLELFFLGNTFRNSFSIFFGKYLRNGFVNACGNFFLQFIRRINPLESYSFLSFFLSGVPSATLKGISSEKFLRHLLWKLPQQS